MRATRGRLFPSFSLPSPSSLRFHAESQPVCQSFPAGLSLPINYSVSWPLKLPSPVRSSQLAAPKPHHLLNVLKRHHLERKSWVYYSCSEAQPSLSRTKGIETKYSEKMALQSKATYSSASGTRSWVTSPASQTVKKQKQWHFWTKFPSSIYFFLQCRPQVKPKPQCDFHVLSAINLPLLPHWSHASAGWLRKDISTPCTVSTDYFTPLSSLGV